MINYLNLHFKFIKELFLFARMELGLCKGDMVEQVGEAISILKRGDFKRGAL